MESEEQQKQPGFQAMLRERQSLWEHLAATPKPILLYGMGDGADKIIDSLQSYGKQIAGVFASDQFVRGQSFRGLPVLTYRQAKEGFGSFIVLVAFGSQLQEVIANIYRIAEEQELYAPNVPLFGKGLFTPDFLLAQQAGFQQAFDLLADETSRQVFLALCDYGVSGKLEYLQQTVSEKSEGYRLLGLNKQEVYLDLGAYNGDTVAEFLQLTDGSYQAIAAVEPDAKNYRKLCKQTTGLAHSWCLNCGIGEAAGQGYLAAKAGRNSCLTNQPEKGRGVVITTIDEIQQQILPDAPVSYIKMDVEGAEQAALLGGKNTLALNQPKLLVAGYHRNEDLFVIPNLIYQLNPNYRIYLRRQLYVPGWEINFYAV